MIEFWGVFVDETGCEFGAAIRAADKAAAWEEAREQYPESRCVQLESPQDTAAREQRQYAQAARDLEGDGWDYGGWEDDDSWDDYTDEERADIAQARAEAAEE